MNFKEFRLSTGMTQIQFIKYFGIPRRTVQNWESETNRCPEYLLELIKYKLENEANKQPLPQLDSEPVVQCKDCLWWKNPACPFYNKKDAIPKETDFCFCGNKKGKLIE